MTHFDYEHILFAHDEFEGVRVGEAARLVLVAHGRTVRIVVQPNRNTEDGWRHGHPHWVHLNRKGGDRCELMFMNPILSTCCELAAACFA